MKKKVPVFLAVFLRWIPAILIASVSWYLSSQEKISHMPGFWNADKLIHLVCFAGFSFWVAFGCKIRAYKMIFLPAGIVSVYGIIDEIHQSFVPGRSSSVFDWCADTIGAVLGCIIFVAFFELKGKLSQE